jgi:tRNA(fMet)-specific endonuclease VapC
VFILDTDAITHDQHAHPILSVRVRDTPREHLFTTSVTVEEQLKGRLAYIHRYRNDSSKLAQGHVALVRTIYYFARWNVGCVPPFTRGVLGHKIGLALGRALRPLVQDYP